jgi:uncharacterized protein
MGRLILIALAALLLVWLLRRALGARKDSGASPAGKPLGELVSCAHCGVHLPRSEARTAGGRYFCSEEHWRLGPKDS